MSTSCTSEARRAPRRRRRPPTGGFPAKAHVDARFGRHHRVGCGEFPATRPAAKKFRPRPQFFLCVLARAAYMPPQTQYARASGPRPTEPGALHNGAEHGSPRRKVYATTSSVLATPFGAGRAVLLVAGSFDRFVNLGPPPGRGWSSCFRRCGAMTPKVAAFLRDSAPATPCLVLDVDRVEENYRRLHGGAAARAHLLRGEGQPGRAGARAPGRPRLLLRRRELRGGGGLPRGRRARPRRSPSATR